MSLFDGMAEIFRDTLGEPVVYTPAGGAPVTIEAIYFDTPLTVVLDGEGIPVDNRNKELHVAAADLAAPAEGDHATVRGVTYRVVPPIRPDGQGMIVVALVRLS